jgi:2-methylisocitrate lyase-like PEP mutase family enzyme
MAASWKELLDLKKQLLLPAAHDALAARLIELAGFDAYQIGGFALVGARHAVPDIDLEQFGEKHEWAKEIAAVSALPVLIDGDDGYGDAKNVTRTVRAYEDMGASALFIEDQDPPKRCGHMAEKRVVPAEVMMQKIRAAVAARHSSQFFLLARTDAIAPEGVDSAIRRAEKYLKAGADGVYVEGPRDENELGQIGEAFRGTPLATSILERGGKTPWMSPPDLFELGFGMILYPTSVLFQMTSAISASLRAIKSGVPLDPINSVDMEEFEHIVKLEDWKAIEDKFLDVEHAGGPVGWIKHKVVKA